MVNNMKPIFKGKVRKILVSCFVAWLLFALTAGVWQTQIKPAQAAIIFTDGQSGSTLETAHDLSAWTTTVGTCVASTTQKYDGSYSIRCTFDGDNFVNKTITGTATVYVETYFAFSVLPDAHLERSDIIDVRGGATIVSKASVVYVTDHFVVRLTTVYPTETSVDYTVSLAINTFYRLGLEFVKASGTGGSYNLYFAGVNVCNRTGINTSGASDIDSVQVGDIDGYGLYSGYSYCDTVTIANTATDLTPSGYSGVQLIAGLGTANYFIVSPNTTFYGLNSDGSTLISGTNSTYVVWNVVGNMTSQQKATFNGTFAIGNLITIGKPNLYFNCTQGVFSATATTIAFDVRRSNVTFYKGSWSGSSAGGAFRFYNSSGVQDCVVDGATFTGFTGFSSGIIQCATGHYNITIQNCTFTNNAGCAVINIYSSSGYNKILNCTMGVGGMFDGIMINGGGNSHNIIRQCTFSHWNVSGGHAIYSDGGSGTGFNEISNCTFFDGENGAGLHIKSQANNITNNVFVNITSIYAVPISLYSEISGYYANDNIIYNNTVKNCTYGFRIGHETGGNWGTLNNSIYDNAFESVTDNCIALIALSNVTEGTKIYRNTFTSCTLIFKSYNDPSLIENTVIYDNDFGSSTIGSIIQTGCTNTVCYNNTDMPSFYMLNMSVVGNGYTDPSGSGWQYYSGLLASVSWTPSAGISRVDFSIDGVNQTTTTSPISITMGADHVGIAYFTGTYPPVIATITFPTNDSYTYSSVSVSISASGGTIDKIWWNCTFTNGTVVYANTTYTVETSMTLGNGTYLFNAMANNTGGNSGEDSIIFTVAISSSGAPSIGTPSASTTVEASTCTISCTLTDDVGLVSGILSTNRTSAWVNNTAKTLSGLSYAFSDSVVLPSAGTVFGYKIFVEDSDTHWTTSSTYTFITTSQGSTPPQGPSGGGYSRFLCMFTVSSNGRALQDLKIRLWENNYSVLIETLQTDSEGYVETELPSGTYEYSADFGGQTRRGYVLLDDAKKITIDFDSAQKSTFDGSSLIKVSFALVVVACAIVAVLAVKNRH